MAEETEAAGLVAKYQSMTRCLKSMAEIERQMKLVNRIQNHHPPWRITAVFLQESLAESRLTLKQLELQSAVVAKPNEQYQKAVEEKARTLSRLKSWRQSSIMLSLST